MRSSVRKAKRAFDIATATAGLLLLLPLLPLVALAIKLDSRGSVFFRQDRVGIDRRALSGQRTDRRRQFDLGGAVFKMVKFRTMRADAEKISGPAWTSDNDPRITRVGAFLRKSKIDELPQLWNVLRGNMSLVGPRPETPHFVEKLANDLPVYRERVADVKPGITGMAQVHCEDDGSFFGSLREKIYYDLLYGANLLRARHWYDVWLLDLSVIWKTVKRLLDFHKSFDRDVMRIEVPRQFEHLQTDPQELVNEAPYGVRPEVLQNPDKITVWWYLPRARKQAPPDRDYLGVHVLRELSDEIAYQRNVEGRGVNVLRLVKYLKPVRSDVSDRGRVTPVSTSTPRFPALRREFTDTIKLEVPSKVHIIPKVEEFLSRLWEELGERSSDEHFAMNLSLLVLEGLTNVMKHAHRDDPEKRIPVEIIIAPDRVTVRVMDYGAGFDLDAIDHGSAASWLESPQDEEEREDVDSPQNRAARQP